MRGQSLQPLHASPDQACEVCLRRGPFLGLSLCILHNKCYYNLLLQFVATDDTMLLKSGGGHTQEAYTMDNISARDEEILRAYKDLLARMRRAKTMWCEVEDDGDHPSPEYVMFKGARQEIRGFCTALELMGFDMEALAAVIEEV